MGDECERTFWEITGVNGRMEPCVGFCFASCWRACVWGVVNHRARRLRDVVAQPEIDLAAAAQAAGPLEPREPPYPRGGRVEITEGAEGTQLKARDESERVKAEAGVGIKGQRLEDERLVQMIVTPASALFRTRGTRCVRGADSPCDGPVRGDQRLQAENTRGVLGSRSLRRITSSCPRCLQVSVTFTIQIKEN